MGGCQAQSLPHGEILPLEPSVAVGSSQGGDVPPRIHVHELPTLHQILILLSSGQQQQRVQPWEGCRIVISTRTYMAASSPPCTRPWLTLDHTRGQGLEQLTARHMLDTQNCDVTLNAHAHKLPPYTNDQLGDWRGWNRGMKSPCAFMSTSSHHARIPLGLLAIV